MTEEESNKIYTICKTALNKFIDTANGLRVYVLKNLISYYSDSIDYRDKLISFVNEISEKHYSEEDNITFSDFVYITNAYNIKDRLSETEEIIKIIPSSMIVSMVSAFDFFILSIIKTFSVYKEGVINSQQTQATYAEIQSCTNLEEVKDFYINKYTDQLFRKSHDEIFEEIKNKFAIKAIKDFDGYKNILLITEIRNLIVHNDGKINIQFKNNLKKLGISNLKIFSFNEEGYPELNPDIITNIINEFIVAVLQLFYIFIAHYFKQDQDLKLNALETVNNIVLRNCDANNWDIGLRMYEFLLKESFDSSSKYTYGINKCMCLRKMKRDKESHDFLDSLDWTNCEDRFKFARFLILEDYKSALKTLKKLDKNKMQRHFQEWPICYDLVRTEEFKKYYLDTYGEEFSFKIQKGYIAKTQK